MMMTTTTTVMTLAEFESLKFMLKTISILWLWRRVYWYIFNKDSQKNTSSVFSVVWRQHPPDGRWVHASLQVLMSHKKQITIIMFAIQLCSPATRMKGFHFMYFKLPNSWITNVLNRNMQRGFLWWESIFVRRFKNLLLRISRFWKFIFS
jgi:hypothetical protein